MNTVSKDLAIKLRENGFPQEESYFYITFDTFTNQEELKRYSPAYIPSDKKYIPDDWYASPTADEILDLLPKERYYTCVKTNTDRWRIAEFDQDGLAEEGKTSFIAESLADACALMYIFLKEQSLLEGETA